METWQSSRFQEYSQVVDETVDVSTSADDLEKECKGRAGIAQCERISFYRRTSRTICNGVSTQALFDAR